MSDLSKNGNGHQRRKNLVMVVRTQSGYCLVQKTMQHMSCSLDSLLQQESSIEAMKTLFTMCFVEYMTSCSVKQLKDTVFSDNSEYLVRIPIWYTQQQAPHYSFRRLQNSGQPQHNGRIATPINWSRHVNWQVVISMAKSPCLPPSVLVPSRGENFEESIEHVNALCCMYIVCGKSRAWNANHGRLPAWEWLCCSAWGRLNTTTCLEMVVR